MFEYRGSVIRGALVATMGLGLACASSTGGSEETPPPAGSCVAGCTKPASASFLADDRVEVHYIVQQGEKIFVDSVAVLPEEVERRIFELEQDPHVLSASPVSPLEEYSARPSDTYFGRQEWALKSTQIWLPGASTHDAWSVAGATGGGIQVGVLDSGVSPDNRDIRSEVVGGWDVHAVGERRDRADQWTSRASLAHCDTGRGSHGTMVAGIISATRNNGKAIAGASEADIVAIRYANAHTGEIVRGLLQARDPHNPFAVEVVNISSGSSQADATALMAIAADLATQAGILVVAAVGNSADEHNAVNYPAATPNVLGVGSVDNAQGFPASEFSQQGWYVDLVAPGQDIRSTIKTRCFGGRYPTTTASGTSFAAPFVSAVAAMVAEKKATDCRSHGSTATRRNCVVELARRIQATAHAPGAFTDAKGAGLLQAYSALTADPGTFDLPTPPQDFLVAVQNGESKVAHLTWTAPAHGSADGGYHIYREGVKVETVTGTQFTDDVDLTEQGKVHYQVTAVNGDKGESYAAAMWTCSEHPIAGLGCDPTVLH